MEEPSKDYRLVSQCIDQYFLKPSSKKSFDVISSLYRHWEEIVGKDLVDFCRIYFFDKQEMSVICQSSQICFEVHLRERDILQNVNNFLKKNSLASLQISSIKTLVDFSDNIDRKDQQKHALSKHSTSITLEQDEEEKEKKAYLNPLSLHSDFLTYPSFGQAFDFFR